MLDFCAPSWSVAAFELHPIVSMKNLRPVSLSLLSLAALTACAKHSGGTANVVAGSPPKFETRIEIDTGSVNHCDFDVADYDGDGIADMSVLSLDGDLRVLLGNGTDFVPVQTLQLGGLPLWMAGADFDADGDRDLAVVRSGANTTDILFNDGNGGFAVGVQLPVGADALCVVAADIDDDGLPDVLVTRPVSPEILWWKGDGAGGFAAQAPLPLPGGGRAFHASVGDVTRDGVADIVVADPQLSRVVVFVGDSSAPKDFGGAARILAMEGGPRATSLGDLSADGHPDIVVSVFELAKFTVVTDIDTPTFGNGGTSYLSFDIPVGSTPGLSTIADVTGDGLDDLVACLGGNASLVVGAQLPAGGVGELMQLDATGSPLRPIVADYDGNGRNDAFVLSGPGRRVNLWPAHADGHLLGARNFDALLPTASWLTGGDLDGDGHREVVVGSHGSTRLVVMVRRADGVLVPDYEVDLGHVIFQVESADLDGDGRLDLVASVSGGLKLLHNQSTAGALSFVVLPGNPAVTLSSASGPFGVAVADLDGDGHVDLVACDYPTGTLHIVPGTAMPFAFGAEQLIAVGGGPLDVVAADFTGDGRLDLAVSRSSLADVLVLRNDGGMNFSNYLSVPVGSVPNYLITADFNVDQRADLVVSNAASGTITVLFGGENGFTGASYPAGATPTALMAEDLTGDGFADILVTTLSGGDFRVLSGDGKGSFPGLTSFPGTFAASDAVLQDMDGDGLPDLLIASLVTNRVSLVRNARE